MNIDKVYCGDIYVVGLGSGDPLDLPAVNFSLLRSGMPVCLRTVCHPVVALLEREGISYRTFDELYQNAKSFEDVSLEIAAVLLKLAASGDRPVIYGVPGPLVGEATVRYLLHESVERGVRVNIWPALAGVQEHPFDALVKVMNKLLSPEGCPWDRKQTHQTLKGCLVEETYEVIEAIDEGNMHKLCEELGDLLLQVVFHSALAEKSGSFEAKDVIEGITEKLIVRHPHVFGDVQVKSADEVLVNWEEIKRREKKERKSLLDGVPLQLPALQRAQKIQDKAARVGFDWQEASGALAKLEEELDELKAAWKENDHKEMQAELGDMFFSLVNLSRLLKIDAEDSLRFSVRKFSRRFREMEAMAFSRNLRFEQLSLEEMDRLWNEVKQEETKV